jgi:hypothetical protein
VTRQSGAARIFLYNWPTYAGTWSVAIAVLVCLPRAHPTVAWALAAAAGGALLWSFVSLVVSLYIYDRSALAGATWIPPLLPPRARTWASIHAGLDHEIDVDAVIPEGCVGRLDIFDPRFMTASSIRRARERTATARGSSPCSPTALALADEACDTVVIAFTAHEIRDRAARERFFEEIRRCLKPGGRALVVEHLRDLANFVAFGPGFLHFLPRREWLRLARHAGLTVEGESRITPWVMALTLERAA